MGLREFYIKRWWLFGIAWFLITMIIIKFILQGEKIELILFSPALLARLMAYYTIVPLFIARLIADVLNLGSLGIHFWDIIHLSGYLLVCYIFVLVLKIQKKSRKGVEKK